MREVIVEPDERGVSLLLEYLLLTAILGVFVVILGLSIHDTLTEAQVSRVVENQFADVASQISAFYTDYILLRPPSGYIKTKVSILPEVGDYEYNVKLEKNGSNVFVRVKSTTGEFESASGLGLDKFILPNGEKLEINAQGEFISTKAEGEEEKPEIVYGREEECPFEVKPRFKFSPSSIEKGGSTEVDVYFDNSDEITKNVAWNITLWNGTVIHGTEKSASFDIKVDDITGCNQVGTYEYECKAEIFAWIDEPEYTENGNLRCNGTYTQSLLVSEQPAQSNPYLVYDKWVEPKDVSPGETFEVHLRLEGRGFVNQAINLSTVHVVDVSGSMMDPTIYKNYTVTVVPKIVRKTINLTDSGKLEIWAYTTDRLPEWYTDDACKACYANCPWYGEGYDASFVRLYVNNVESGNEYSEGAKLGKYYSDTVGPGNYTIEVVARAPKQINLTILVKFNSTEEILNQTVPYENYQEISFELPGLVEYKWLAITGLDHTPYWSNAYWSDWNTIEYYTVDDRVRYWRYIERICGYNSFTYDGENVLLDQWVVGPSEKTYVLKRYYDGNYYGWYYAWNNYGYDFYSDFFVPNPTPGTYKIIIVPLTKESIVIEPKVVMKRMDAAKLAAITFNNMLGEGDFVGLATFTTYAERISVNQTPLKYMTKDKLRVNNEIEGLYAKLATDHADALYWGVKVFPIWPDETQNNCTECINNTRPLMILLTDGETTTCDKNEDYFNNTCKNKCVRDNGHYGAQQALCVADYIKRNIKVNGFNIPICTIGFGTDIGSDGQAFLRDIASPRPDNGEACYFFATTSEELIEAYKTIFNIFQIAAKNISIHETVNVSTGGIFEFVSAHATSNKGTPVNLQVEHLADKTVIKIDLQSIQKDEVVELVVKLKVKEDAPEGTYDINIDGATESYIEFTALNYLGQETTQCPAGTTPADGKCKLLIQSDRDKVTIRKGEGGAISLE